MRIARHCSSPECPESPSGADGYCAFHHLVAAGVADYLPAGMGLGSLEAEEYLEVLLEVGSRVPFDELLEFVCGHGALLGGCYLGTCPNLPGLALTAWEQRAVTYSEAIPYN